MAAELFLHEKVALSVPVNSQAPRAAKGRSVARKFLALRRSLFALRPCLTSYELPLAAIQIHTGSERIAFSDTLRLFRCLEREDRANPS